ncbi:CRISPR-associated endonuclease Cas2 [Levilactobacillus sp. HBUAS70063]|uniref:CRISPR-associated endonuclease Cas2 n=1 Tax=Levilactobacillus sp. HBUAS70063 TaxID=3109359 RepID=UPI003132CCD6
MRIIVMFDLPTKTKSDRRNASKFRKNLINAGFVMMQLSVYYRLVNGTDMVHKYEQRVSDFLPPTGQVRLLTLTEKQFSSMEIMTGTISKQEQKIDSSELTIL